MSEEAGGWHVHVGHPVYGGRDPIPDDACPCLSEFRRPVLVLDPADPEVRDTIAKALGEHIDGPCDEPRCFISNRNVGPLCDHLAETILAALAPAPREEPWEWHPDGPEAHAMLDRVQDEEEGKQ